MFSFGLTLRHFLKTNCIFQCVVFSIGKKTHTFFEFSATWISTDFNGKSIVYFAYFLNLKNVFKNQKVHDLELGDRSGCLYRKTLSCRVLNISCYSKSGLLEGFSKFRRGSSIQFRYNSPEMSLKHVKTAPIVPQRSYTLPRSEDGNKARSIEEDISLKNIRSPRSNIHKIHEYL